MLITVSSNVHVCMYLDICSSTEGYAHLYISHAHVRYSIIADYLVGPNLSEPHTSERSVW